MIHAILISLVIAAQTVVGLSPVTALGPVKPMNAGNNGPIDGTMESYTALRVPYARTHDTALGAEYGGHCIDINQIFPDFRANANHPRSYDFTNSDVVLQDMLKAGTKPFFRLGQSIEHQTKKYGIYPPGNNKKWARICEHIIRHYNEGWEDGYHMGIEYWEIWNEPDLDDPGDRWRHPAAVLRLVRHGRKTPQKVFPRFENRRAGLCQSTQIRSPFPGLHQGEKCAPGLLLPPYVPPQARAHHGGRAHHS